VPGWDDGAEPPERTGWGFIVGVLLAVMAWVVVGVALRVWGWL
jgi:hypothetical protein